MLLDADTFQRLFLSWNTSVRGYFHRLVVWRLSRLGLQADGRPSEHQDPWIIAALQSLNTRLEAIRKRHDELDPLDDLPDDDLFDGRRDSIDSMRGVTDQPWAIEAIYDGYADGERERDADVGGPWSAPLPVDAGGGGGGGKDKATMSKVKNWLKVTIKGKDGQSAGNTKAHRSPKTSFESRPTTIMSATPTRIDPYSLDLGRPSPAVISEDGQDAEDAPPPDEYALDQDVAIPQSASDNSFFQFEVRQTRSPVCTADRPFAVRDGRTSLGQL